jgi:hypothetical protein
MNNSFEEIQPAVDLLSEIAVDKEIADLLAQFNIHESIPIDKEAKNMILSALRDPDVDKVWIDEEGGLNIEYRGENE